MVAVLRPRWALVGKTLTEAVGLRGRGWGGWLEVEFDEEEEEEEVIIGDLFG
jgi:hypothetical protein